MTERSLSTKHHRRSRRWLVAAAAIAALGFTALIAVGTAGGGDDDASTASTDSTTTAGGVEVVGADVHLGQVALNTTVEPTWTLVNTSDGPVSLGAPHATVLEGCCPGPLSLDDSTLAPGATTMLRFPLQMHEGMDGAHDFDVHVPIATADGEQAVLTVGVDGMFGG
jgi:hypothetical protein